MNERIKELVNQCRGDPMTSEFEPRFDKEKFAQLIVKECAGIYDKIDNGNLHMGTDNYLEALNKTFFGVEE